MIKKTHQAIHTGDSSRHSRTSALEIDKVLSELSRLYLERFRTLREGTLEDLQLINSRITSLKAKLQQL